MAIPTGLVSVGASTVQSALTGKRRVSFISPQTAGTIFTIDATLLEKHNLKSTPTKFPIEDGTSVSDHIILDPPELVLTGVISDTPLSLINSALTSVAGAILPPVGIVTAAAGIALFSALQNSSSPSAAAYAQLLSLRAQRARFDVVTTLRRYANMFITDISVPRDAGRANELEFDLTLTNLTLVSPKTVNINIFSNSDVSADETDKGKQETENEALKQFKAGQAALRAGIGG